MVPRLTKCFYFFLSYKKDLVECTRLAGWLGGWGVGVTENGVIEGACVVWFFYFAVVSVG